MSIPDQYRQAWEDLCAEYEKTRGTRMPMTNREKELAHYIDGLVAASVEAHRILGTPKNSPMTLVQRCEEIMGELNALRKQVNETVS